MFYWPLILGYQSYIVYNYNYSSGRFQPPAAYDVMLMFCQDAISSIVILKANFVLSFLLQHMKVQSILFTKLTTTVIFFYWVMRNREHQPPINPPTMQANVS